MKDKGRSPTSHAKAYSPIYCHPSPHTKKLTRDELHERSTKGLYRHYDEPWSREHHCKKGRHLVIEPMEDEDNEPSEEVVESKEEAIEEESQPADYAVHALTDYSNDRTPVGLSATIVHSYGGDFLRAYPGRTIEPRGKKDKGHPRPAMPRPTAPSTAIQASALKKLTRDELRERSAKGLC
ncbi:hypothetical protein BHM03_00014806 [Ensete ventricosum]|nr:hypothetical protein BHM03_00014806 [Ensete ventricosum]